MKQDSRKRIPKAGEVLSELIDSLGLRPALSRHNVVRLWPRIVDPVVLRHVQAEKVEGSTLYLVADSSVWMNEMSAIKPILLEKVNDCLKANTPPITDIRFRQHSRTRPAEQDSHRPQPALAEEDRRIIRTILEPVADESLKRVLKRILEKDRRLRAQRQGSEVADE